VQERVAEALKQADPIPSLMAVAESAGFALTEAGLTEWLGGRLSDGSLDAAAGGLSAPAEMFAEFRRSGRPGQVERE
jgi:hypothetical protein